MHQDRIVRAFRVLHLTLALVILYLSVRAVTDALSPAARDPHAVFIGAAEAVAAVLLLFPRTFAVGAAGLLATFAVAAGVHLMRGQLPAPLFIYAAAVSFVWTHGPVPWRGPLPRPAATPEG